MDIRIYMDGGSKGNGFRNDGYGSIAVFLNGERKAITTKVDGKDATTTQLTVKWPGATNNEAELKTALLAMTYADEVMIRSNKQYPWVFVTDSQLVANLQKGMPKKVAEHLRQYYSLIVHWLTTHPESKIEWHPREDLVAVLGH